MKKVLSCLVLIGFALGSLQAQAEFQNPIEFTNAVYAQTVNPEDLSAFDLYKGPLDDSLENSDYPIHPQATLTTGSLCQHPSRKRYPEGIDYCSRDVDSQLKRQIIRKYDDVFKYRIGSMPRSDFKIDHLIPLCAGGSNEESNLWPQYKKVYNITDPLEPELCAAMSRGKLLQRDAVTLILRAKNNLDEAAGILRQIRSL